MPAVLLPEGKQQFFTTPGVPAVGYKLATFAAGTSTPQTTWSDALKVGANTNPIILDARGEAVIFWDGVYKAQLQDSTGAVIWTVDNITSQSSVFGLTLLPFATSVIDIGSTAFKWRDAYFSGTGKFDTNVTINGVAAYNGTSGNIGSITRTAAEIAAAVTPTDLSFSAQPYDLRRYSYKADNVTVDDAAVSAGYLVGTQTVNGAQGSAIAVPIGNSILSTMIPMPNRVRTLGVNKRGSYFKASATWAVGNGVAAYNAGTTYGVTTGTSLVLVTSGGILYSSRQPSNLNNTPASSPTFWTPISSAMLYAQNGYAQTPTPGAGGSMFDSTLENLSVDCNNLTGLGAVLSSAWQEDCGLRGAMLINFDTYGIKFQDAFGGASLSKIVDCEIFRGTLPTGGIGVDLSSPMGAVGAFMLDVSNTSITGGTNNLTYGVNCNGNSLLCRSVHFENCTHGIFIDGTGWITLEDVTGAGGSALVTNLVTIASTFTGTLIMKNCRRNGATNFLLDNRSGGLGVITGYDPPFLIQGSSIPTVQQGGVWSGGKITVAAGVVTVVSSFNVASVVRSSAGVFVVTEARSHGTTFASACSANSAQITSGFTCGAQATGGASYTIQTAVAGVLTDPLSEVNFQNVRMQ